jgi:thiamine monophosphate kinase
MTQTKPLKLQEIFFYGGDDILLIATLLFKKMKNNAKKCKMLEVRICGPQTTIKSIFLLYCRVKIETKQTHGYFQFHE